MPLPTNHKIRGQFYRRFYSNVFYYICSLCFYFYFLFLLSIIFLPTIFSQHSISPLYLITYSYYFFSLCIILSITTLLTFSLYFFSSNSFSLITSFFHFSSILLYLLYNFSQYFFFSLYLSTFLFSLCTFLLYFLLFSLTIFFFAILS